MGRPQTAVGGGRDERTDAVALTRFHLHLVSDSTGETVHSVARACLVQFDEAQAIEHVWSMVRTKSQIDRVMAAVEVNPGLVLYTIVNDQVREILQEGCRRLQVSAIPVLDPVIGALASYLGRQSRGLPGQQHLLDSEYFARIDAMTFAINHDDGQSTWGLNEADVCLVGVSRTSKTPTCLYLANRGVKAANVPIVPGMPLPPELVAATKPLIVGLTNDPERLIHLRRNRLSMLDHNEATDYTDLESVQAEVREARRLFAEHRWPVIDVTRRSIEETAASIYRLLMRRHGADA
ncbi:MAG TPA: pyruvate, water dikinase regulatory protein [Stellaceae bacterium]|nr:pyruvate, water dikinase regulatory protein [Stellaceae bacterium]